MNLRREAFAAMRRVGIALGVVLAMVAAFMAAFWLVLTTFNGLTPG